MSKVTTYLPDSNGKLRKKPSKVEKYKSKHYEKSLSKLGDQKGNRQHIYFKKEQSPVVIPQGIKQRFGLEE